MGPAAPGPRGRGAVESGRRDLGSRELGRPPSQHATRAVARPWPPCRAPGRSAHQPRERARRRTNTGSSSSSGRRSPGKHQSDARFQERAASRHSCWRTLAVGGHREASCCPVTDRPPSPLPLPSPATSAASHGVGCLLCAPPTPSNLQCGS